MSAVLIASGEVTAKEDGVLLVGGRSVADAVREFVAIQSREIAKDRDRPYGSVMLYAECCES